MKNLLSMTVSIPIKEMFSFVVKKINIGFESNKSIYKEKIVFTYQECFLDNDLRWRESKQCNILKLLSLFSHIENFVAVKNKWRGLVIYKTERKFKSLFNKMNELEKIRKENFFSWIIIDDEHMINFYRDNEKDIIAFKTEFEKFYRHLFFNI